MSHVNPLPSLLRASAEDAANRAMRKAARTAWSRADYTVAARTQSRLIRACYGRKGDKANVCFVRFAIAQALQKEAGYIALDSDWRKVMAYLDQQVAA